jgi:hypothetical protein
MKTLEEAVNETFNEKMLGHGKDCYCEALQIYLSEHREISNILIHDPVVREAILLAHLIPVSTILPAFAITMIEVGIRIGLKMSTPDLENIL